MVAMSDVLSRESYAAATGRKLEEVRDPFVATWGEYVEYSRVPGVWAADFMIPQAMQYYAAQGYTLRIWRACFENEKRLWEGDTKRWKHVPEVLSRYSLIEQTVGEKVPGKKGFLDLLHWGSVHFRPLDLTGASPKTITDILDQPRLKNYTSSNAHTVLA